MKYKVLVVDDEWKERESVYASFEGAFNSFSRDFNVEFTFLEDPVGLAHKMTGGQYSAVLVDARLDVKWPEAPLRSVISAIGSAAPIVLVSSQWDNTNDEEVTAAFHLSNCKTFLRWSEIAGGAAGGQKRAAMSLMKAMAGFLNISTGLNAGPNEELRLLHISDLQFGPRFSKDIGANASQCAEAVLDGWNRKGPHFIAITGDIAERGLPSEYELAFVWFNRFFSEVGLPDLPNGRIFMVPGNHDYCLPLAASSRIRTVKGAGGKPRFAKDGDAAFNDLSLFAFQPYADFVMRVSDCPWIAGSRFGAPAGLSWVEERFRHLGLLFYGLNTNNPINPEGFCGRKAGAGDMEIIQDRLLDASGKSAGLRLTCIGMGHHGPIGLGGSKHDVENSDEVKEFLAARVKTDCFLHGHVHRSQACRLESRNLTLLVGTSPTLTLPEDQRPENTLRGFMLLDIKREAGEVTEIVARPFNYFDGRFMEDEARGHRLSHR